MNEEKQNLESVGRYLCFSLGKEKFAMPLLQVKEVIANTETSTIPQSLPYFKGIMNLRGQVISIIDLRAKLKIGKPETNLETTIVILDLSEFAVGVIVDSVDSVTTFDSTSISTAPILESSVKTDYILGVARHEKCLTLLIDLNKVINQNEIQTLKLQTSKVA